MLLDETVRQRAGLVRDLVAEIRDYFASHADPQVVAKYAKYFTEGYDAYGLSDAVLHPKRKEWLNAYGRELGLEGFLDLGDTLWPSGKYEEGFLAIYFVSQFRKQYTPETFERLGGWFSIGVYNWAHNDVLCRELSHFLARRTVTLEAFASWRQSPFKYQRRAVPVSMLALLKTEPDYTPLLDFVRPLMLDGQKVVQQGLGWFLRDGWKRQPGPVEAFLLEWKDSSPRLIFQYATEKMAPEHKALFRKAR